MIGDLYNDQNVVVGQAACLFAPQATALPTFDKFNMSDPFDPAPWLAYTVVPGTSTSATFTVGAQTTTAQTFAGLTAAALQAAIAGLSTVGSGNVRVTGSTAAGFQVLLQNAAASATLTAASTGGSGFSLLSPIWLPSGATDAGWKYTTNKSTQDINIEEQSTPVGQSMQSQKVQIDGSLSEDISQTLALAYNALLTKNAATSVLPGFDDLVLTDDVLYYAVALITKHSNGLPRVIYAPKWSQLSNVGTDFRRSSAKRMYPVSFATNCKPSAIRVVNFTAPHS